MSAHMCCVHVSVRLCLWLLRRSCVGLIAGDGSHGFDWNEFNAVEHFAMENWLMSKEWRILNYLNSVLKKKGFGDSVGFMQKILNGLNNGNEDYNDNVLTLRFVIHLLSSSFENEHNIQNGSSNLTYFSQLFAAKNAMKNNQLFCINWYQCYV